MSKNLQIRNSTAEFLVFTKQAGESTIDVRIEDETVWLTQKLLAVLFEVEVNTINYYIKEIYKIQEQKEAATIRNFRIVQTEGKSFDNTALCKINFMNAILIKKELGGANYE